MEQSNTANTKQIPFKQIKPVKFMGINSSLPFNSLISQSKLIYLCGRSIILQNIKTYQQKIIWTNQFLSEPQTIQHIINIHRQNIVGIGIKDDSQTHLIIIMNINSQINNYQHLNKRQREKDRLHYLKNIPGQTTYIEKLKFLHQGSLFAVVIGSQDPNLKNKNIFIYSSLSGDLLHKCNFESKSPLIQGLQLNRINYTCIIKNEIEQNLSDNFLQNKKAFYNKDSASSIKQNTISFFNIILLNSSQLSSKNDFLIELKSGQIIIEVKFFQNHKKTFAFFLLNSGFVLIYMVNERGFHDCIRIDAKIDKMQHMKKMKNEKQKNFFTTEKTQQCQPIKLAQKDHQQGNTIELMLQENNRLKIPETQNLPLDKSRQSKSRQRKSPSKTSNSSSKNNLKVPIGSKSRQSKKLLQPQQYYYPSCICCTSCKVVIGYQGCSFIGVIKYSAVDHRQFKFWYIFDFFYDRSHVDSIRKICFSQDGCHCSVLAKVMPNKVEPARKKRNAPKIQSKYKYNQNKIKDSQNQVRLSTSKLNSKKKLSKQGTSKNGRLCQKKATIINFNQYLHDNLQFEDNEQEKQHFSIMHLDFISGIIEHQYHNESIEESLTSSSLHGTVEVVQFNEMNNTMLILMNDNRLYYYYLNPTSIHSEKDFINGGRSSLTALRKKLQTNNFFAKKSIMHYLSPESILLWVDKIRFKPFLILCHPVVFQLVLVFQDNIKFHFYNQQKLFQSHHVLSLKNCKAASYSPFGDKLALGTVGSIWLVDSYTHVVIKKISLVIFPTQMKAFSKFKKGAQDKPEGVTARRSQSVFISLSSKTVSRIQYVNNDDLMIQTGNTMLSMLLNYQKVVYYGSTSEAIQGSLLCYDYKHRLGVIASDTCVKIITKCSINSKNKCEQLAKVDLCITAIKLCGDIDILFLGGANGVLYFIRWPQFFQSGSIKAPNTTNKLHLFHSPIIDIQISINYKQLFVMSMQGMMIICELTHSDEVQKIGKDVSFRMSKKIDLPLPLLNKWLISTSDEEKRAQNITKLMGNEAQIKNNQLVLADDYKAMLQQKSSHEKQQLEQELKNQIKKYQIDSGISKLQLQIAFVRDEIKRISGKRQIETKKVNENMDEDLHKIFVERQKLQIQLKQLQLKSQTNKQTYITQQKQISIQYHDLTNMQVKQEQKMNIDTVKMYESKMRIDRALEQNMKQDFLDQIYEIQKYYTQQLQDMYQQNNTLTSQNRNKKVQISQITDKMRQLSARMYELQNDLHQLQKQQQSVSSSKKLLSQKILQTDKKYHALIKKTKQIQITLNKIRTTSQACQLKYNDLQKQMQDFDLKWKYLQQKRQESQIDFVEQFKLRNLNVTQIQQFKQKVKDLKKKRKQVFESNVLLKDLIKPYQKQIFSMNRTSDANEQYLNCMDSSIIQLKKQKSNKLTSDVQKWSHVKDDNKQKFIKYNQKLQQQNNKLVYRFNQLQKQFKQLVKLQNNIKCQITSHKQKQKDYMNSNKWEKFSFVLKQQDIQQSKPNSLSVYRQGLLNDKFNSTSCYFTSPNSLPRELNCANSLKKVTSLLRNKYQENQILQLTKKSSKNVSSLIMQKRQQFKQRKQNEQNKSLYHGVVLDKVTLKPKKTLCLSLHQSGQQSGKFVTQY